ncbi:MAG: molybdenum ABC transporter ATP-binding protein, partial [Betaproteobacteria bacterium]|nr:molybdenum ABC transporter ATP-binding protein [Betaproteobacteria bacterium]
MNPPALDIDLRLDRAGLALDAQLQLPEGGITVVFGASGAGKTTL